MKKKGVPSLPEYPKHTYFFFGFDTAIPLSTCKKTHLKMMSGKSRSAVAQLVEC